MLKCHLPSASAGEKSCYDMVWHPIKLDDTIISGVYQINGQF